MIMAGNYRCVERGFVWRIAFGAAIKRAFRARALAPEVGTR